MLVYLLMLIISCCFSYISLNCNNKKKKIIFQILSAIPFILISAIRYDVGTDYSFRYKAGFETILNGYEIRNYELGFSLLNKFCLLFTKDYQSIFIVTSILINSLVFYVIYKNSDRPVLSIIIYFVGAFFFQSMNGVRQYLAMAILMLSLMYVEKGQIIKTLICGVVAFLMHNISIIMFLPMLFFCVLIRFKKKIVVFKYWFIIITFLAVFLFKDLILDCLYFVLEFTRFKVYIDGMFDYGDFQIIPMTLNIIIYLFLYFNYIYSKNKNNTKKILLNFQLFGVLLLIFTGINTLFLRISYMFTIFQIVSIPVFLEEMDFSFINKDFIKKIRFDNLKFNKLKFKLNNKILTAFLVFVLTAYSFSFIYINILNNVEGCLPYQTFFGRENVLNEE